ncbi:MAG: VWA domain-containing protein [Chitinophagaceae bacterium]
MLRFQHIEYLYLLAILPLLALLYMAYIKNRKKKIERLGDVHLVEKLMPQYSSKRKLLKFVLMLAALFFGIVGLANLQAGRNTQKIQRKGQDIMLVLDVSKSMLAKDVAPSRIEKSKQFIYKLIQKLSNNRMGLVLFAGRAYVSVPLTSDMNALQMNLSLASPNMVPSQGTVLHDAIQMAKQSFNTKDTKYKCIVLISDGEDHDKDALQEAKKAYEEGIIIHTVGIGSVEGTTLIDEDSGELKKDEDGKIIVSKLNEDILQEIASASNGKYQLLSHAENNAESLALEINSQEQKGFGESLFTDYNHYFQYFLALSFLFLFIEHCIPAQQKI